MQEFSLVFLVIAIVLIVFLFKKRKELHLGKPQLFLYSLIGLVICIRSLYAFTEITSPGVDFLTGVLIVTYAILSLAVGLLCITWALMIYPNIKAKLPSIANHKLLNNYTTPVVLIIIMATSNSIESIADSKQSKTLGFNTESDFKDAKRNNIYSTEEYMKYLANKKAIEAKKEETKVTVDNANKHEQQEEVIKNNNNNDLDRHINVNKADSTRTYLTTSNELESIFGSRTKISVNDSGKEKIKQFIFDGTDEPVYITYSGKEVMSHWDSVEKFIEATGKEDILLSKIYGGTATYYYHYYFSPSKQQKYLMICNRENCTTFDMLNVWRLRGEFARDGSEYLKKHKSE